MIKPRREERERNPDEGYGNGRGVIFAAFAAQFSRHGDRELRNRKHRVEELPPATFPRMEDSPLARPV